MSQDTQEDTHVIKDKLMGVLWSLRDVLPESDTKDVKAFINNNEYRVAFETLVCVLNEDDIAVPSANLHVLNWIATMMKLPSMIGMVNHIRVEFSE